MYPEFEEHTGKVWFDRFGVFENNPAQSNSSVSPFLRFSVHPFIRSSVSRNLTDFSDLIQFVQNSSFETPDSEKQKGGLVLHWDPEGEGYHQELTEAHHGSFSIAVDGKGGKAGAVNHVTIFQAEPAKLVIEGRSKAEAVDLGSDPDARYAIVGEVMTIYNSPFVSLQRAFRRSTTRLTRAGHLRRRQPRGSFSRFSAWHARLGEEGVRSRSKGEANQGGQFTCSFQWKIGHGLL